MNDVEQRLSAVLHTVTPEPPVPYSFRIPADDGTGRENRRRPVDVVDLGDAREARRGRRTASWFVAAATVVALGAGIVTVSLAHDDHNTAPAKPGPVSIAPSRCVSDNLLVQRVTSTRIDGGIQFTLRFTNTGPVTCAVSALPRVSLIPAKDAADGSYAGGDIEPVSVPRGLDLAAGQSFVYRLQVRSTSTCGTGAAADTGWDLRLSAADDGFTYNLLTGMVGCTLTAETLSVTRTPG